MKQSRSTSKKQKQSLKAAHIETVNAFYRDGKTLKNWMEFLIETKQDFTVRSSTYSTTITLPNGNKLKFFKNKYDDHVFIANKLVLKDIQSKPHSKEIIEGNFQKVNYDSKNGLKPFEGTNIINIDISSAYASTLLNQKLINKPTFDFLQRLKKFERLPAIGMLARKSMIFTYEKGKCVDTEIDLSKHAQIFYFLIAKVEEAMQKAKAIANEDYIFHWVDGIFIDGNIDKNKLDQIEQVFKDMNYEIKYENIERIKIWREEDDIWVDMIKNGEAKVFSFIDRNLQKNVVSLLEALASNYESKTTSDTLSDSNVLPRDTKADLSRSRTYDFIDTEEWLA